MANLNLYINEASLDSSGYVWAVGRNLSVCDGNGWTYYNSSNSAVPSNGPYFKDTRSISIDPQDNKWIGSAVTSGIDQNLVFYVTGSDVKGGTAWDLSTFGNLGALSPNWEVPTIYACPYGNDVLAFVSPLNGGGGTGASGDIGVTGGYLWRYDKVDETWAEVVKDYTWPHIYEMTAVGTSGGDYEYYLCTNDGLQIIHDGKIDSSTLDGGDLCIPTIVKRNTRNSGIGSDIVYSVSFDEDGNYWLGTDLGLVYWDGTKYYRWDIGGGLGVTKVVARKNGHVFFKLGDPTMVAVSLTNGFYHFNGDTFTNYTTSNSNLTDNRVIDLLLVREKSEFNSATAYNQDLWIIAGNNAVLFDYTLPHVYGTSKYTGTTGWNFVYYTHTTQGLTADTARLPKADKYTWDFPTWTNKDLSPLLNSHPGMDPRNFFLETDFKDLANNTAGNQAYWNNGPVTPYDDAELSKLIPTYTWLQDTTQFTVTSTCKFRDYNVVTGYSSESSIVLGQSSNLNTSFTLTNPNPSGGTGSSEELGFIAFYTDGGQVMGAIPFRGSSTRVLKAVPSLDDSTMYVLGTFKKYIEAGQFVYGSEFPGAANMNVTGVSGPTGAPIGFSNIATPGITASYDYPWILNGATGATSGAYIPDTSVLADRTACFIAEVDFDLGNQVSYGGIDFTQLNEPQASYCLKNFRYFPGASSGYDTRSGAPTATSPATFGNSDLAVSRNSVRLTTNFAGGISTLKNEYGNPDDLFRTPYYIFSDFSGGSYLSNGVTIDLNADLDLKGGFSMGATGISLNNIESLSDSLTYILTGSANNDVVSSGITISHPKPGYYLPFFILNSSSNLGITGGFVRNANKNTAPYTTWINTNKPYKSGSQYYVDFIYTGNSVIRPAPAGTTGFVGGASGSLNIGTLSIKAGGGYQLISTYEALPSAYEDVYNVSLSGVSNTNDNGDYYVSLYYPETPGVTGSAHNIIKRNVTGTYIDSFSTFPSGVTGNQSELSMTVDPEGDLFLAGSNFGVTGPSNLPYPGGTASFVSWGESYKYIVGKSMGDIISRVGSGAWTWVDVHNSNSDLYVPMLSTLFLSNYDSKLFGKKNNRWVLKNAKTGEVLLDVKNVPYFIYTFSSSGYFSIVNSVEDSMGNVYEITKPAFIKVVNQSIPVAADPNPEYVNSADYGYIEPKVDRNSKALDLAKDLTKDQIEILLDSRVQFGSGIVIPNNPDATFTQ